MSGDIVPGLEPATAAAEPRNSGSAELAALPRDLPCRPEVQELLTTGSWELRRLFLEAPRRDVTEGEALTRAGTKLCAAYHLRQGWACRTRAFADGRRAIIDIYLPGDFVGLDMALSHGTPDAVAMLTAGSASALEIEPLVAAIVRTPALALAFAWAAGEPQRRIERLAVALRRLDGVERVALTLFHFHERLRRGGLLSGRSYTLPLTQRQLGEYVGMTAVHVNRVLRALRERRIVTVQNHVVIITDPERLARLAGAWTESPGLAADPVR